MWYKFNSKPIIQQAPGAMAYNAPYGMVYSVSLSNFPIGMLDMYLSSLAFEHCVKDVPPVPVGQ